MKKLIVHSYKLSMMWVRIILLGASLTLSSCNAHRAIRHKDKSVKESSVYQLQVVKESSEDEAKKWTIYSRKIKGTNFFEYQIEGEIVASPSVCLVFFRQDMLSQAADLNNKKYPIYNVVSASQDSLLTYVIHHEPFPFKNTEMSIRYIFHDTAADGAGVIWHEAWDETQIPLTKNLKRVETFRGSWSFISSSVNACQATNGVQFDPKKMPRWLFEPMIIKFLKEGLEDLREGTTSKR